MVMAMDAIYKSQFDVLLLLKLNSLNEGKYKLNSLNEGKYKLNSLNEGKNNRHANITLFLFMSYYLFNKRKQHNCPNTQINHLITQISLSKIDKK